jgi:hypothetical protein
MKNMKQKIFNRIALLLVIILALAAGFFQSAYKTEIKRYNRLEDRYIRLEMMIGEEKAETMIDNSYQYVDETGTIIKEIDF